MKFLVTNEKESRDVVAYFGHFHDAYIRTITLSSRYETLPDKSEILVPGFDVVVVFSHHAYAKYNPYNRKVRAEFLEASDFRFELKNIRSGEYTINEVLIHPTDDGKLELRVEFFECEGESLTKKQKAILKFEKAVFTEE